VCCGNQARSKVKEYADACSTKDSRSNIWPARPMMGYPFPQGFAGSNPARSTTNFQVSQTMLITRLHNLLYEVLWMIQTVSVPLPLLKELYEHFDRIEEILATLEELSDKEGLERIKKGLEEYKKKEYITVSSPEKIREALKD